MQSEKVKFDKKDIWQHSLTAEERKAGVKPREELLTSMTTGMLLKVIHPECVRRIKEKHNSQMLFMAKLNRVQEILSNRKVIIPNINWEESYELLTAQVRTIPNEELIVEMRRRIINGDISIDEAQEHIMSYAHNKRREKLLTKQN